MQERILDGTYRILQEVGRGGFGAVYRGVKIGAEGSGQVAIKLLNRNPKLSSEDYIRFQREATMMSQLVHPGVVSVLELSEDAGAYFIVMEFVSGMNLKEFTRYRGGKLSLIEIVDILLQASEALEYVHSHNIVHRDIKPQNMLIEERNERGEERNHVKLVDFGVARLGESVGAANMLKDSVVGTYAYMAPESTGLTSWQLDARADIYSLGIVAYELLAGKTPFHDLRNDELLCAHVTKEAPPILSISGQPVPAVVEQIVRKCIAKSPENRYQSMFGLVCDLRRLQMDMRSKGQVEDFQIAKKDIGIGKILENIFVGRDSVIEEVSEFLELAKLRTDPVWAMIRSDVGLGKSRCLQEIRRSCESTGTKVLTIRFSETEQKLPLQSLSLAINEYLYAWQRENRSEFRRHMGVLVSNIGLMVDEVSRLIPALRQFSAGRSQERISTNDTELDAESFQNDSADVISFSKSLDRRYVAPNQRINEAILSLLTSLIGGGERLIFLMDDVHLADNSTLSLFSYLLDLQSRNLAFSFVFTMRDKTGRSHLILDNFVGRLSTGRESLRVWSLSPFESSDVRLYLSKLGVESPSQKFVDFCNDKSTGSLFHLHTMVRQMLAQDVLVPIDNASGSWAGGLAVNYDRLENIAVDFVSIEMLVASIVDLDAKDDWILRIAAISYDSCDFDFFLIDDQTSPAEMEKRVIGLVKKGYLEVVGAEHAPLRRRAFVFSHEKIRNAVISRIDIETRRNIHTQLARCIESLYRNPRRDQILALAKHYDGSGEKASFSGAVKAFLRAAKVYLAGQEHNLSRYYIDRAIDVTSKITDRNQRLRRLRECYEAEYMIQAAQGNLVEASTVCKNLIEITFDPQKRESLQTFWSQLLVGLGRHQLGYQQAVEVLKKNGVMISGKTQKMFALIVDYLVDFKVFGELLRVIGSAVFRKPIAEETTDQVLLMMAFAHFHGGVAESKYTIALLVRSGFFVGDVSRRNVVARAILANIYIMRGKITQAYKIHEECEYFLQSQGMKSQLRWVMALRCIWLDYPTGKMDRLLSLVDGEFGSLLPSSGVMHFESYGMRAWLVLLSPSSRVARSALSSEVKRRRKSDKGSPEAKQGSNHALKQPDNNEARRVIDSGENNQYTALALFADAMRFAFCDKIDPLKRATELLRRQSSVSSIGDSLGDYAISFQALVLGHQHEALKFYLRATQRITAARVEVVSLIVADALRFAAVVIPFLAISFGARGWPWGGKLVNALRLLDSVLVYAEGKNNPARSAMNSLFKGFVATMEGNERDSFALLEKAIAESRSQRSDLLEAISLSVLAGFSAKFSKTRSQEYFQGALKVIHAYDLRLLERQVVGLAQSVHVDLVAAEPRQDGSIYTTLITREKRTSLGLHDVIANMSSLFHQGGVSLVLTKSAQVAANRVKVSQAIVYCIEAGAAKSRFNREVSIGNADSSFTDDRWIVKLLPHACDDPVRIFPMSSADFSSSMSPGEKGLSDTDQSAFSEEVTAANAISISGEDTSTMVGTVKNIAPKGDALSSDEGTRAARASSGRSREQYLVLVAMVFEGNLVGWIALLNVESNSYSSRDVEHDFILLGLHVGKFVSKRLLNSPRVHPDIYDGLLLSSDGVSHGASVLRGDFPKSVSVESFGKIHQTMSSGFRVFGIKSRGFIAFRWEFEARATDASRKLGDLVATHLEFVALSLSQSSEMMRVDDVMHRISSDVISIMEILSSSSQFESVDLSVVVYDSEVRRAVEGDFGGVLFGFGGNGEVVREYLQENHGILVDNRLVYHERERYLSGASGWMFLGSAKSKSLHLQFSKPGFLEHYFLERLSNGPHLASALGVTPAMQMSFAAILVAAPEEGA